MKKITIFALFVVLLFLTGCAQKSETAPSVSPPTTPAETQESQPAEETAEETVAVEAEKEDATDIFSGLMTKKKALNYKVEYEFSTEAEGQTYAGKQTWVMKSPNMKIETDIPEGKSAVYYMVDSVYMCTDADGQTTCMKFELDEAQQQQTGQAFSLTEDIESDPMGYNIHSAPSRTIAGVSAKCFKVTTKQVEEWVVESCYSSDGIPLFFHVSGAATTGQSVESTLEATSYSTKVSDSEFELPAEPMDLSELMQNMPGMPTS